jgi:hypothetical protein
MKKYLAYAGFGVFILFGAVFFFKSKSSETSFSALERDLKNDSGKASDSAKRTTASQSTPNGTGDAMTEGTEASSDSNEYSANGASIASSSPKYYKIEIKDKYAPAPEHVMKALAKEEIKMTAVAKKAQLEGDELVSCVARESICISGSNENRNCVTHQRNCDGNGTVMKLTEMQLVESMGRTSYEKYRNHLEFVERTGSSIRAPGSLGKF